MAATSAEALPRRLVLALDGVSFRDMQSLQRGVTYTDVKGRQFHRQAFNHGYYPVSRMISTYPSTSDVAWTDIFGDRPLPGYQRTYYCAAANAQVAINGITTTMEHERQMTYQLQNGSLRTLGYVFPHLIYKYELHDLMKDIADPRNDGRDYYAYLRSTDDAQHLSADILEMLCALDPQLEDLRARCRAQEGRDLEILILSDHGHNQAGPAKRIEVRKFLKHAGYHISKSLRGPKDVVLPTAGIETWVEIHNAPAETERLAELLTHLEGVDVVTAKLPGQENRFLVLNPAGARACIEYDPTRDAYRYIMESGDPLDYKCAVKALRQEGLLDADGFASSEAWMGETMTLRYPVALERIARGHTRVTLNPATIILSLDNRYVHASWLIKKGSERVRFGGTHGALDDINAAGILLSNFAPTQDTCSSRVAALYGGFQNVRDYRAEENGAEWVCAKSQALTRIARSPLDTGCRALPADGVFLRAWSPAFAAAGASAPLEVTIRKVPRYSPAAIRRGDEDAATPWEQHLVLTQPIAFAGASPCERVYALPADLALQPGTQYRISGHVREQGVDPKLFEFSFRTDARAMPIVY